MLRGYRPAAAAAVAAAAAATAAAFVPFASIEDPPKPEMGFNESAINLQHPINNLELEVVFIILRVPGLLLFTFKNGLYTCLIKMFIPKIIINLHTRKVQVSI